jgi:hypothetical protein
MIDTVLRSDGVVDGVFSAYACPFPSCSILWGPDEQFLAGGGFFIIGANGKPVRYTP